MAKNVIKPQTIKIYYKLLNICRLYQDAYITLLIGGFLAYFYECDIKPTECWELVEAKHSGIWAETTYQKKTIKLLAQGVLLTFSQEMNKKNAFFIKYLLARFHANIR